MTLEDVPSGPPINITISSLSSRSMDLSWNPPLPEHRNGEIISFTINITNLDNETVHHFTVDETTVLTVAYLEPYTPYECAVFASTAVGIGMSPAIIVIRTDEEAPESHPLNSTGYAINSTHIALNWSSPHESDLNGVLREFRINVTEATTSTLTQYSTPPDTTEIIIGPLHPFYIYHCTIVAFTVDGGPSTTVISVRTHEDAPSGPPVEVLVNVTSSSSVSVSWSPPALNHRNGIIRHYFITLKSETMTVTKNISSGLLEVSIAGLQPYTTYNCTVQAETVLLGPSSAVVTFNTLEDVPSGSPQDVTAHAINSSTLYITWTSPDDDNRNGNIEQYLIILVEEETGMVLDFSTTEENIRIFKLHPFNLYTYSIAAVTIGPGPYSQENFIQMPEAAPSSSPMNIQISDITSTTFNVSWTDPITMFHNGIIRSYLISVTEVNTGRTTITSSIDTTVTIGSVHPYYNYTCEVAAVTVSHGPFSEPVVVTTAQAVPSGPPINLKTEPISSSSISIFWKPPLIHEQNGIITHYTINIIVEGITEVYTATNTTITVEGLLPFTEYSVTVAASTAIGMGPFSPTILESTLEDAPAGPPANVSFSEVTSTSFVLTWLEPETPNGIISHYLVSLIEVDTGTNSTYETNSPSFYFFELHPFYTYSIHVFAVTIKVGPPSSELIISTLEDSPSAAPVNIMASTVDSRTLLISWAPPLLHLQNGVIMEYIISISSQETGEKTLYSTEESVLSFTVNGLHPNYVYSFTVAAATEVGMGPSSDFYSIRMPEDIPTGIPLNVSASPINSTAIFVTWQTPLSEGQNGNITGYSIIITEKPTNTSTIHSRTKIFAVIVSLHPYYEYMVQIAAETKVGRGPYGDAVMTRTLEEAPSGTPVNVRISLVTSRTISVDWDPVPSHLQNGHIDHYYIIAIAQETSSAVTQNASSTSTTISGLHPSYNYSIKVAAMTIALGPFSNAIFAKTLDDAPTSSPTNITALSTNSTSIILLWQPPIPEEQNGQISSYHISITEIETKRVLKFVIKSTTLKYIVNNLHPFYTYNCSVAAFTVRLGPSAHYIIQTLPDAPRLPPRNVAASALTPTAVSMSWFPPLKEGLNGPIRGYYITVTSTNTDENFTIFTNSSDITIKNLHPFYFYRFFVSALTTSQGPNSEPVTVKMPESTPTSVPKNITVEVLSPSSVKIQWLPGNQDTWNGIITSYTIEYTLLHQVSTNKEWNNGAVHFVKTKAQQELRNNPNPILATNPLMLENIVIDKLEPYFVYSCSISYANSAGKSDKNTFNMSLPYSVPDGLPTEVSVLVLSQSALLIRWDSPLLLEQNGPIIGYSIILTYSNGTKTTYSTPQGDIFSLQIEGLAKFHNLNISVAAKTPAGVGPPSVPIFVNRTHHESIEVPATTRTKVNGNNVEVSWTHPHGFSDLQLAYELIYYGYKKEGKTTKRTDEVFIVDGPHTIKIPGNTTTYELKGLIPGLTYSITVQTVSITGYRINSTEITIDIGDETLETASSLESTLPIIIPSAAIGGAILLVCILAIIIFFCCRRSNSRNVKEVKLTSSYSVRPEVQVEMYKSERNFSETHGEEYDIDDIGKEDKDNEHTSL